MSIDGKTILHFDYEEKETLQIPFFLKSKGLKVIYASTVSKVIDIIQSGETDIDLILINNHLRTGLILLLAIFILMANFYFILLVIILLLIACKVFKL